MIPRVCFCLLITTAIALTNISNTSASPDNASLDKRPWIQLDADAALLEQQEIDDLEQQLKSAVGARGFRLSMGEEPGGKDPIARIHISGATGSAVAVQIEIADKVTTKTVSRNIDLQAVPRDGWVLTIVLSADELLRASWAELLIEDAPPPAVEVPVEVVKAVKETVIPTRNDPKYLLGLGMSGAAFSSKWMGLGIDARIGRILSPRLLLLGQFQWQRSQTAYSTNASAQTDVVLGGLGLHVEFTKPDKAFGLGAIGLFEIGGLTFDTRVDQGFEGNDATKLIVMGRLGFAMWVDLAGFVRPFAEIGLAIPIMGTEGKDGDEIITALGGVGGNAVLGLCFLLGH